jgi:BCD family chlorophyll transporter-like MFS transporter
VRVFFGFLLSGIFFLFIQQVVLEPFGGDVFGLSVRETTLFNAYQMVGVLAGMGLGGAWLVKQIGLRPTAGLGALVAAVAFGWLALAAILHQASWLAPAILLMGLGMGAFTVAGIVLMMGMTVGGHAGLYMGAWTLAEATARGLAGVSGGALFDLAQWFGAPAAGAYATVFALEGAGMVLTMALLAGVDPGRFRAESALAAGR